MGSSRVCSGFTLVEIVFALFVGLLLMGAFYFAMVSGQKSSGGVERKVAAQQDVRAAIEVMALEIGMASYNPMFTPQIWRNGPNETTPCRGAALNQGNKGIQEATATSITVQMDINENSRIYESEVSGHGVDGNEIIRYGYNIEKEYITRNTNCGGNQAFLGDDPNSGNQRTVRVINATLGVNNGADFPAIFRYYNGRGIELFPEADHEAIPNIRRIDITLAVETDETVPGTSQGRRMIYSTSVIVRNHAIANF